MTIEISIAECSEFEIVVVFGRWFKMTIEFSMPYFYAVLQPPWYLINRRLFEISRQIFETNKRHQPSRIHMPHAMPVDEPSPSSSVPNHPDDPGPIAGLVVLFLIGLSILCAGIYKLDKNRCVHIPFGSLSFTLIFLSQEQNFKTRATDFSCIPEPQN
jgi:hypothetical protein